MAGCSDFFSTPDSDLDPRPRLPPDSGTRRDTLGKMMKLTIMVKVKKITMQITCQEDMINVGQARESEYPLGPFNVADYLWHAVKKSVQQ